jgi:hypothetical protein
MAIRYAGVHAAERNGVVHHGIERQERRGSASQLGPHSACVIANADIVSGDARFDI